MALLDELGAVVKAAVLEWVVLRMQHLEFRKLLGLELSVSQRRLSGQQLVFSGLELFKTLVKRLFLLLEKGVLVAHRSLVESQLDGRVLHQV